MAAVNAPASPTGAALWQATLGRGRERLNERVAAAVATGADPGQLRAALREVGPVVDRTLAGMPRARLDEVADALVATICELVRQGAWAEHALGPWVVTEVALPVAAHLDDLPAALLDLRRAAERLWGRADLARWASHLRDGVRACAAGADGPPTIGGQRLRELGAVAGWRAGDVRLRAAALRVAGALPEPVAAAVLGLPNGADSRAVLAANAVAPLRWPGVATRLIGGHRALGGCFDAPPRVLGGDGLRWLVDDGRARLVVVDAHGWLVDEPDEAGAADEAVVATVPTAGARRLDQSARWQGIHQGSSRIGFSTSSFHLLVAAVE